MLLKREGNPICKIFLWTWEPTPILCITCSWSPHSAPLIKITGEFYWKQVKPYSLCSVKWKLISSYRTEKAKAS